MEKKKSGKKIALIIILIIVAAIVALFLVGMVYYTNHFYQNGSVFGIPLKNKTVEQVSDEIQDKIDTYELTVKTRDGNLSITATDFGMTNADADDIQELMDAQPAYLWFLMSQTTEEDIPINVSWEDQDLHDAVFDLDYLQDTYMTDPEDAYLERGETEYEIIEEVMGNKIDKEKAYEQILAAVTDGLTEVDLDTEEDSCYYFPSVYSDDEDLVAECDVLNSILDLTITYDFGDRTYELDGDTIEEWITLKDDFTFEVSETEMATYVYDMAYDTDTFAQTRSFTTSLGTTISLTGGDYGWCIDQSETVTALNDLILAGESVTTEPVYKFKGICRDTNDIGGNYVEIDIATQTMWVYSNYNCVVETPVVTGCVAKGNGTPFGSVWAVDARITDYNLVGQGYDTKVGYWLPFNGNVGIHDASWRSQFGEEHYLYSGSHGCINTPPDQMPTVYEYVQIGWPIVVYQSEVTEGYEKAAKKLPKDDDTEDTDKDADNDDEVEEDE